MSEIMTAKDLCLWYGDNKALKDINIAIPEKSITALIGPSGCGKSTFLKTLNRMNDLIPIVRISGEVCYNGRNIFDKDVDVNELRRDVGMVFQKPNPFPMSIYDNIAYGPRTHGITSKVKLDEIVEQALRDAAIWDEVKTASKRTLLAFREVSNSVFVLLVPLRSNRKFCLWMSRRAHLILSQLPELKNWHCN